MIIASERWGGFLGAFLCRKPFPFAEAYIKWQKEMVVVSEFKSDTPPNIKELIEKAGNKADWKERFGAVQELRMWKCQQSIDVITRIALHDKVFKVKEEAFRAAQAFGISKGGRPLSLGRKDIGYKHSDFNKAIARAAREAKIDELDVQAIKDKLKIINPEMFDVMSFEKKDKFDEWVTGIYKSLPKK